MPLTVENEYELNTDKQLKKSQPKTVKIKLYYREERDGNRERC